MFLYMVCKNIVINKEKKSTKLNPTILLKLVGKFTNISHVHHLEAY